MKGVKQMAYKPLPIGIDDFEKIITKEYYYVDKTLLIKDILDKNGEAILFTRPRRFGKTLNLSMLRYYFEKPLDGNSRKELFQGLKIMESGERYTKEQGQYPVITLTLKSAKQPTWNMAHASLIDDIAREYKRHESVLLSETISDIDKERFLNIRNRKAESVEYAKSLLFLSECLSQVYDKKVIILIDEYDVPLEHAYYSGFYDEMVGFIRSLFESALKTNPYLEFSVISGCLRISKESIFTGLNNLKIISILAKDYDEHFGFVEEEVKQMLQYYHCESKMDVMKRWYNGYLFGDVEVYNPWSVINFMESLCATKDAFPTATWSNTSSNSIVRDLIYKASDTVRDEIELLTTGATIEKKVHEDITYEDIYSSEDNLWNFLLFTGYLKQVSIRMEEDERYVTMSIPNTEVRSIYQNQIQNWFRDKIEVEDLTKLYDAMLSGKQAEFQQEIIKQLRQTISYMDGKEAFYHGFLLGLMANLKGYRVRSNREAGDGRYDICIYNLDETIPPVVLELKVSNGFKEMEADSLKALKQIDEKRYDAELVEDGYTQTIRFGIAFYKKNCRISVERHDLD